MLGRCLGVLWDGLAVNGLGCSSAKRPVCPRLERVPVSCLYDFAKTGALPAAAARLSDVVSPAGIGRGRGPRVAIVPQPNMLAWIEGRYERSASSGEKKTHLRQSFVQ